jgi:hypothetical protein
MTQRGFTTLATVFVALILIAGVFWYYEQPSEKMMNVHINEHFILPLGKAAQLENDKAFKVTFIGYEDYKNPTSPGGDVIKLELGGKYKTAILNGFGPTSTIFENYKVELIPKLKSAGSPIHLKITIAD